MNKIYKFRKDRIIPKALNGIKTLKPVKETIGDWIRDNNRSLFGSGMRWYNKNNPVGKLSVSLETETRVKDANGKEWILKPDGSKVSAAARRVNTRAAKLANMQAANTQSTTDTLDLDIFIVTQEPPLPQLPKNTNQVKKRVSRKINRPNYTLNFNNLNLSDVEKEYIRNAGFNPDNARDVQNFILSISKNANLGARGGAGIADGYWGEKSAAAFLALRNQNIFTPIVDKQEQSAPVIEQPIDAPDPFGYKTSNTYEDDDFASKLKRMGIRSNADLMHFMYESGKEGWKGNTWQTQFRNDVDKALGGDYSDANIRRVFKTKNGWGTGFMGRGDFGDFQNALQTNAGVWNGIYDAKELASRTGANGTIYSSPEMMKKFESIKLQPNLNNLGLTSNTKFDFSNMKFNNIFTGNTGASTLGNIPSTKPINLSLEFTKGLTSNIPSEVYKPNTSVVYKPGTSDWLDWVL